MTSGAKADSIALSSARNNYSHKVRQQLHHFLQPVSFPDGLAVLHNVDLARPELGRAGVALSRARNNSDPATVAALYERRLFPGINEMPAVIDRRYRSDCPAHSREEAGER